MFWLRKQALRLSDEPSLEELDRLLDRIDFESCCYERLFACRRESRRYSYRQRAVAIHLGRDGQPTVLVATTRNLSDGGLSFIHGQQLQPGEACQVRLLDRQGRAESVGAVVAHCRAVSRGLFEVGVRFDRPIAIGRFVGDRADRGGAEQPGD